MRNRELASRLQRQFEGDKAKAGSREFLKKKIIETFPDEAKRKGLKVAFFTGPSLVEADQIYIPCGISPRNIHGIEMDLDAFKAVKAQNDARPEGERINLFHGRDTEFFDREEKFNVISLDYLQNYGPAVIRSLGKILSFGRDCIDDADGTLLAINLQARREQVKYQWRLYFFNMFSNALWHHHDFYSQVDLPDGRDKKGLVKELDKATDFCKRAYDMIQKYSQIKDWSFFSAIPGFLDFLRIGLFEEVYIRSGFAPLMNITWDDYMKGLEFTQKEMELPLNRPTAFDRLDLLEALCTHPGEEGGFIDPFRFAMYAHGTLPAFFTAVAIKLGVVSENGSKEHPSYSGFVLNRMLSLSMTDYSNFDYTSESGTPMLLQAYVIKRLYIHNTARLLDLKEDGALDDYARLNRWFSRLMDGKQNKFAILKRAASARYGPSFSFIDILKDFNVWKRYRAAQELRSLFLRSDQKGIREILKWKSKELEVYLAIRGVRDMAKKEHHRIISSINLDEEEMQRRFLAKAKEKIPQEDGEGPSRASDTPQSQVAPSRKANGSALSKDDKDAVRDLNKQGYTPSEIYNTFYAETDVTKAQVAAVCAWNKIYAKRKADADGQ